MTLRLQQVDQNQNAVVEAMTAGRFGPRRPLNARRKKSGSIKSGYADAVLITLQRTHPNLILCVVYR